MLRKGYNFRIAPTIWMEHQVPSAVRTERVDIFGNNIIKENVVLYKVAKTNHKFPGSKSFFYEPSGLTLWCKMIPCYLNIRTNMMYGRLERTGKEVPLYFRKVYWCEDGKVYTSKVTYDHLEEEIIKERFPEEFSKFRS